MAEAVGADHAFFSTCGGSLYVKPAMLSVAGPYEEPVLGGTRTSRWCRVSSCPTSVPCPERANARPTSTRAERGRSVR